MSHQLNLYCFKREVDPDTVANALRFLLTMHWGNLFQPNLNQHPANIIADFQKYVERTKQLTSTNALSFDGKLINYVGELVGTNKLPKDWDVKVHLLGLDYLKETPPPLSGHPGLLVDNRYVELATEVHSFNDEGVLKDGWPFGFFDVWLEDF